MQQPRLGHQPALDGLRGVAVILVLLFHAEWVGFSLPGGFLGVDVFFVLSGFLITTLLLERTGEGLWPFYRRRLLRLTPAVGFLLLVNLSITAVLAPDQVPVAARTSGLIAGYVFNWYHAAGGEVVHYLGHAWSLAVEEQFYILWPVVLALLLQRLDRRSTGFVILGAACIVLLWRAALYQADPSSWHALYHRTDTRADALLIGAAAAILRPWLPRIPSVVASAALLALVTLSFTAEWNSAMLYRGGLTGVAVLAAVVTLATVDHGWPMTELLSWRPLRRVGVLSYSLYLWHYPVFYLVGTSGLPAGTKYVVAVPLAFLLAWASHRYVEQPFLRLKARLERPRRAVPTALTEPAPA